MPPSSDEPQAITLNFKNLVRVAGETIEGTVDLNLPLIRKDGIEELRLEMQGIVKTRIYRTYGQVTVVHKQVLPLFEPFNQPLWSASNSSESDDVASYPFRFTIPENLPPSFCYCEKWMSRPSATVRYSLEVVGTRPGVFHRNRRVQRVFLVMPAATASQLEQAETMRQGWSGPWKGNPAEDKIRQGIWGDYSHVSATLSLPDLPSLPISAPIPYTLTVTTETKTLDHSERPEDKHGKPIFPAPPTQASELSLSLRRKVKYTARDAGALHKEKRHDSFDLQKTVGLSDTTESPALRRTQPAEIRRVEPAGDGQVMVDEPEWVPGEDGKKKGVWRRSVHFTSLMALPFAPTTWSAEILEWSYKLQITIPFPGVGNDLKLEIPIQLNPSAACPPPGSSNLTYAEILPAGPPPMLDLPPAYWAEDGGDSDSDEKKEKKNKFW
ncbi:arrestin-N domain-containing protein [Favolaschia claudopus]|uniref:Arrestin-N domain-containing protein n=1 Tax=Favolaschia claudopus TaxID=2862362 RepID=A0AAW0CNQ4_9AGAR